MARVQMVTVSPSPTLSSTEYVPGIPAAGITLPIEEVQPLIDAGLVVVGQPEPVITENSSAPDVPAETEG